MPILIFETIFTIFLKLSAGTMIMVMEGTKSTMTNTKKSTTMSPNTKNTKASMIRKKNFSPALMTHET